MASGGLFGFGISMGFILGLSFVSLRTDSAKHAAALSGMAQLMGYTLAAIGPYFIGVLYDRQHAWQGPLYVMLGIGCVWMLLGWLASPIPQPHKSASNHNA